MPDTVITAIAERGRERTRGSKSQMRGSANTPMTAVKTIKTAVSLSWKYLSTRYLSIWVEIAQDSGPRIANRNQRIVRMLHRRVSSSTAGGRKKQAPHSPPSTRYFAHLPCIARYLALYSGVSRWLP